MAGGPVEKADAPFTQGTVADMVVQEVDRRAAELLKSDPTLKTIERAKTKVWERDRHLRQRYEEHRGAAV